MSQPGQNRNLEESLHSLGLRPEPDGALSGDELRAIELIAGSQLPDDYKWFLRSYGASNFEGGTRVLPIPNGGWYEIREFNGAEVENRPGIPFITKSLSQDLLAGQLPIGADIFGNQIVITAATGEIGHVGIDDGHRTPGIAISFTDFVTRLEPDPSSD